MLGYPTWLLGSFCFTMALLGTSVAELRLWTLPHVPAELSHFSFLLRPGFCLFK